LYNEMEVTWQYETTGNEWRTTLAIPYQTKRLTPILHCPDNHSCRVTISCQVIGPEPCGRTWTTCGTHPPTAIPTMIPTRHPIPSSHGDPIIWTFNGECYDLSRDGMYLASHHDKIDHDIKIGVYNDYMREIQIVNKEGGILLSINNLGDVINNWPYAFKKVTKKCPEEEQDVCGIFYDEYSFDAQQFKFTIQVLPHDYLDQALKEGESGIHLDIYPRPYKGFAAHKNDYTGLYFENPLPETLQECPSDAKRYRN